MYIDVFVYVLDCLCLNIKCWLSVLDMCAKTQEFTQLLGLSCVLCMYCCVLFIMYVLVYTCLRIVIVNYGVTLRLVVVTHVLCMYCVVIAMLRVFVCLAFESVLLVLAVAIHCIVIVCPRLRE